MNVLVPTHIKKEVINEKNIFDVSIVSNSFRCGIQAIDDLRLTIDDSLVRRLTPQGCGAIAKPNFEATCGFSRDAARMRSRSRSLTIYD